MLKKFMVKKLMLKEVLGEEVLEAWFHLEINLKEFHLEMLAEFHIHIHIVLSLFHIHIVLSLVHIHIRIFFYFA